MTSLASIYFDTDSTGTIFLCEKQYSGKNVDFVKRTPIVNSFSKLDKEDLKGILNCNYGKAVLDNMRKDYIVVHSYGKVGIILKHTIIAVLKENDEKSVGRTRIVQTGGTNMLVDEYYSTIIKAVLS